MTDHPITPPPELVQQWTDEIYGGPGVVAASDDICLAKLAAQWGADQELEACCRELEYNFMPDSGFLRAARRPKPSLKEQALALIDECTDPEGDYLDDNALSIIRRALEQLDD